MGWAKTGDVSNDVGRGRLTPAEWTGEVAEEGTDGKTPIPPSGADMGHLMGPVLHRDRAGPKMAGPMRDSVRDGILQMASPFAQVQAEAQGLLKRCSLRLFCGSSELQGFRG